MKTLYFAILGAIAGVLVSVAAQAASEKDLTDFMSPEDLAQEIGADQDDQPLMWKASAYAPRMYIVVNKAQKNTALDAQTVELWLDGQLLYRFIASTGKGEYVFVAPNEKYPKGKRYFADTYEGNFRISARSRNHKSKTWGGASMPFAQFFDGGIAVHATTPDHFHELGRRASGGCVRMHPRDAKIVWDMVGSIGVEETMVIVYDGAIRSHPLLRLGDQPLYDLGNPLRTR